MGSLLVTVSAKITIEHVVLYRANLRERADADEFSLISNVGDSRKTIAPSGLHDATSAGPHHG